MEDYDEMVAAVQVDEDEHRPEDASFGSSGGVSEDALGYLGDDVESEQDVVAQKKFSCSQCGSILKTSGGFLRHTLLHKVKDANSRKPTFEDVLPEVEVIVAEFLTAVKEEVRKPSEDQGTETDFIDGVLKAADGDANWVHFLSALAEPIVDMITERSRVLPFQQYEDYLMQLNQFFHDEVAQDQLRMRFQLLCGDISVDSCFVGITLYRLINRVFEGLYVYVLKEMRTPSVQPTSEVSRLSAEEFPSFAVHVEQLLLSYYKRCHSSRFLTPRCNVIRKAIIHAVDSEALENISESDFLDPMSWVKGPNGECKLLELCPQALEFFVSLEASIRASFSNKTLGNIDFSARTEIILGDLIMPANDDLMKMWVSLTNNFMSEVESLLFLKGVVNMLCLLIARLSVRKESRIEMNQQRMQKHALRTDLKRN